jgi:hypothetical protein
MFQQFCGVNLMKKVPFSAVALAVGALFASSAFASVNLDTGVTTGTYASELNYSSGTGGTAISANTAITTKLGFGVSGGQDRYIRVDLSGGKLALVAGGGNVVNTTVAFSNSILVSGGAVGDTFAIYQVTAAVGGHAATDSVTITLPSIHVTNGNAASVTSTYSLYETAQQAVANVGGTTLYTASGALLKFSAGLKWVLTPATNTAAVEAAFRKFAPNANTTTIAIGTLDYGVNSPVLTAGGVQVTLANLVTGVTKAVFTGDFGAVDGAGNPFVASGLTLDGVGSCPGGAVVTVNTAKTSGEFTLGTTPLNADLCYTVPNNNTVAVPAQIINAALDVTAATNTTTADVAAAKIGEIVRDGTELQAPWFTTFTGYQSRFVLTSTHSADAAYTAAVITNDGSTCTTGPGVSGTIKAGKQLQVQASDICTAISGFTRAAVVFTIAAPNSKIQGTYVVTAPDGTNSFGAMMRPGTN